MSIFSRGTIEKDLHRRFAHQFPPNTSVSDLQQWTNAIAIEFPTANILERRLGLICSVTSSHLGDDDRRYDHLPMFDHGGWPRN